MKAHLPAVLVAALLLLHLRPHRAGAITGDPPLAPALSTWSETEAWILEQVKKGEIADLNQHFPNDESKRTVRARFLEDLVTGELPQVKVHRRGVRIMGAIFNETIGLASAEIGCELRLSDCKFKEDVNFRRATFAKIIAFDQSVFSKEATFESIKAGSIAFFDKATFDGPVNFFGANFANRFSGDDARFQNKDTEVILAAMKVGEDFFLRHAVFAGGASLRGTNVIGSVEAEEARFQSKEKEISLDQLKVGGDLVIRKAILAGPARFLEATIGGGLNAAEAQFQSGDVLFDGLKVAASIRLEKTLFSGAVSFVGATISGQFVATDAKFQALDKEVLFVGVKVGGSAIFERTLFNGPAVSFTDSSFLDLRLDDSGSNPPTIRNLDLSRSSIARTLNLQGRRIDRLKVESLHVDGPAVLVGTRVTGFASVRFCDFTSLDLSDSQWPSAASENFSLQGTNYRYLRGDLADDERVSHEALLRLVGQTIYQADVYNNLEAFFARQGYRDDANRAFVAGKVRERKELLLPSRWRVSTTIGVLIFEWMLLLRMLRIPLTSWRSVAALGFSGVFISWAGKLHPWIFSWVLYLLVGYGRYPEWAAIYCVLIVCVGYVVFAPSKMELQPVSPSPRRVSGRGSPPLVYHRFWYSLELFLPFVKLQTEEAWTPKRQHRALRHYMRVHTLLGWMLIPIALAAVSGLFK